MRCGGKKKTTGRDRDSAPAPRRSPLSRAGRAVARVPARVSVAAFQVAARLRGAVARVLPAGEQLLAEADRPPRGPVPPRARPERPLKVAALFVDPKGVYAGLPDVEVWDEARDARLYEGPWPVVAHPPCARWCAVAHLVEKRYGYAVGDDGGTFESALRSVRTYGGVLEHPAFTKAWKHYGLPRPPLRGWQRTLDGEYVCELDQHAYGFPGRKRTWLYVVGVDDPPALDFTPAPAGLPVVSRWGWSMPGPHYKDEYHTIRPHKSSRTPPGLA